MIHFCNLLLIGALPPTFKSLKTTTSLVALLYSHPPNQNKTKKSLYQKLINVVQ